MKYLKWVVVEDVVEYTLLYYMKWVSKLFKLLLGTAEFKQTIC